MAARQAGVWRLSRQLHISAPFEFHEARLPPIQERIGVHVVDGSRAIDGPDRPPTRVTEMFSLFRRKARKSTYTWKPALDLTDPRVAAVLLAFGRC